MYKGAAVAVGVGIAVALSFSACSSFDEQESNPGPTVDGGGDDATSSLDASADGDPEASADAAVRFCAARVEKHCADFEDGIDSRWSRGTAGSSMLHVVAAANGQALRIAAPPGTNDTNKDELLLDGIPTSGGRLHAELDLTLEQSHDSYVQLIKLSIEPQSREVIVVSWDHGVFKVERRTEQTATEYLGEITLGAGMVSMHVSIDLSLQGDIVSGKFSDGIHPEIVFAPKTTTPSTGPFFQFFVGVIYQSAPGASFLVDNVIADWN